MDIKFKQAQVSDAATVTTLRQQIWATTYRGIYNSKLIDEYDFEAHKQKDIDKITGVQYDVFIVVADGLSAGYFILQCAPNAYIQSLYLLKKYQHQGIGKRVFNHIKAYFAEHNIKQFECHCNTHNTPAQQFYRAMGGRETARSYNHINKRDDQITYLFTI